jgi:hypothetical protein
LAGYIAVVASIHRAWQPMGERLLRIVQLEEARRVPERRDLLLAQGVQVLAE